MSDIPAGYRSFKISEVTKLVVMAVDNILKYRIRTWKEKVERVLFSKNSKEKDRFLVRLGYSQPKVWTELEVTEYLKHDEEPFGASSWVNIFCRYNDDMKTLNEILRAIHLCVGANDEILLSLETISVVYEWTKKTHITGDE